MEGGFFTYTLYVFIASSLIATSPHGLGDDASSVHPFINKQSKLVTSDKNFDKVLKNFTIGWI